MGTISGQPISQQTNIVVELLIHTPVAALKD